MRPARRLALAWLVLLAAAALAAPLLGDPTAPDLGAVLRPPSAAHPLGTDGLGRDVLVRTAAAVRTSLLVALAASAGAAALGAVAGTVSALVGGRVDRVLMRLVDLVAGLPHTLLAAVLAGLWPGQPGVLVAIVALTHWMAPARLVRALVRDLTASPALALARAEGATGPQLAATLVAPAVLPQLLGAVVLQAPHALALESTLSFLGLGLSPDSPSLGLLLEDAREAAVAGAGWLLAVPAVVLVGTVLALDVVARARRSGVVRAGRVVAADGLALREGEAVALTAPSGAGKTTLLRALAGLTPEGVAVSGAPDPAPVPGRDVLFAPAGAEVLQPGRRVGAQLRRTLRHHRLPAGPDDVAARLADVGLDPAFAGAWPHELSGGMRRRAGLALQLCAPAPVLLVDEPTGSLDAAAAERVGQALLARVRDGAALLVATHDARLVRQVEAAGGRVLTLRDGAPVPAAGAAADVADVADVAGATARGGAG